MAVGEFEVRRIRKSYSSLSKGRSADKKGLERQRIVVSSADLCFFMTNLEKGIVFLVV